MRLQILVLLLQISIFQLFGQETPQFQAPVKIPIYLSGNFGELRPDHFHSGIDIKTQGAIGQPVYSIEQGYVSRIKVQANGYGNSIYVTHPGGYTSQYGHLDHYREDIAAYVKNMQYRFKSHGVDLYPGKELFTLDKGELIAYSGNTGGSTGPHLHFEVRIAAEQRPTNVLKYGFDIKDHVAPRFLSLFVTPLDRESRVNGSTGQFHTRIVKDGERYTIPYGTAIHGNGKIGLSVEAFDYLDGASNRCGVYLLDMFVNGELTYQYHMDEFSFAETRYVNAHMDYGALVRSNIKAHRLYRLPNDRLRVYGEMRNEGMIELDDGKEYQIEVVATDVAGNRSVLEFSISGWMDPPVAGLQSGGDDQDAETGNLLKWSEYNRFEAEDVKVEIPANALYEDCVFTFSRSPANGETLSGFYQIGSPEIPLHLSCTLSIETAVSDPLLRKKLLLVTLNDEDELESAGGAYSNGAVVASISTFGNYAIAADTVAPSITPLHRVADDMSGSRSLRFTIKDNLSGIDKFEGYIDDQWVLFEYDLKNDLLVYTFDPERIKSGSSHRLELYVTDAVGNAALYQSEFIW